MQRKCDPAGMKEYGAEGETENGIIVGKAGGKKAKSKWKAGGKQVEINWEKVEGRLKKNIAIKMPQGGSLRHL